MVVARYPSPLDASSSIPPPPQAFFPSSIRHPSPTMYDNSFALPTSRSGRRNSSKSISSAELKAAAAAAAVAANITPHSLSSPISPRSLSSPSSCPSSRSNISLTPSMSPSSIISIQRNARQEKKHHRISVQNIALSSEEQKQIKSFSSRGKKSSAPAQTMCSATLYTNVPSEQLLLQQQHLLEQQQQQQQQEQQQEQQRRSDKVKKSKPRKDTSNNGLSAKSRIAAWAAAIRPSFPSRSSASSTVSSSSSSFCSGTAAASAAAGVADVASLPTPSVGPQATVHASERRQEDQSRSLSCSPPASSPAAPTPSSPLPRHHPSIDTPPVNVPSSSSQKPKVSPHVSRPPKSMTGRSAHVVVPSQPQPRSLNANGGTPLTAVGDYSTSIPTSPPRAGRGRPLSRNKGKKVGSGVISAFCIAAIVILVLC